MPAREGELASVQRVAELNDELRIKIGNLLTGRPSNGCRQRFSTPLLANEYTTALPSGANCTGRSAAAENRRSFLLCSIPSKSASVFRRVPWNEGTARTQSTSPSRKIQPRSSQFRRDLHRFAAVDRDFAQGAVVEAVLVDHPLDRPANTQDFDQASRS